MNTIFLELPEAVARDPGAPYAVLPIPYERTVSYGRGTARGPAAIIDASIQTEDFDEELLEPAGLRVQTLPAVRLDGLAEPEALAAIEAAAAPVMEARRFLLGLGGEHTVTLPLVTRAKAAWGCRSVLQIDAHADLRDTYSGTPYSHACVMRRIRDLGLATVHVGIRALSSAEHAYAEAARVPLFRACEIAAARDEAWIDRVVDCLADPVYVTVDVDGLDPSVIPGTGTPEPGGLGWYQTLALLRRVFARRRVVAADVVELAPLDGSTISEYTAARLAAKMLLYHSRGSRAPGA